MRKTLSKTESGLMIAVSVENDDVRFLEGRSLVLT